MAGGDDLWRLGMGMCTAHAQRADSVDQQIPGTSIPLLLFGSHGTTLAGIRSPFAGILESHLLKAADIDFTVSVTLD